MADTTDSGGIMSLAVRQYGANTISSLMRNCVLIAAFGLYGTEKPQDVFGVGNPSTSTVLSGANLSAMQIRELEQDKAYYPQINSILENDFKRMGYRDTVPERAQHSGSDVTFTYTVVDGAIATVTPSGGTGYSGSAPTLIMVDAIGSAGFGALLQANMSGGTVDTVTVLSGGSGYAASGGAIVVNVGYSEGEKFTRPEFHYSHLKQIANVYDNDVNAVKKLLKQGDDEGSAMIDLIGDAYTQQTAGQAQIISQDMWTGSPTSQSAAMWDSQFGLLAAVDDGGTTTNYAGLDRSMSSNYFWRSITDDTRHDFGVDDLVDDANLIKGLGTLGGGIDTFVVPLNLLAKYKKQEIAQLLNVNNSEALREMGKFGFRSEVLQYGNVKIIGDYHCPQGTAIGLNLKSWIFHFLPGRKFTPSKLYDQKGIPGGIEGQIFYVDTQWRMMCVAPNMNVKYTNLV